MSRVKFDLESFVDPENLTMDQMMRLYAFHKNREYIEMGPKEYDIQMWVRIELETIASVWSWIPTISAFVFFGSLALYLRPAAEQFNSKGVSLYPVVPLYWSIPIVIIFTILLKLALYALLKRPSRNAAHKAARQFAKYHRFAKSNLLETELDQAVDVSTQPGMVFHHGKSHKIKLGFHSRVAPFYQIANASCEAELSKQHKLTYNYAFIRLKLPRQVPHIVLDSPKNNIVATIGFLSRFAYSKNRQLKLEGNFNEHFRLYVPEGYERDAIYIFTPDIMQLMMEFVNDYDIELVEDSLYIWRPGAFTFTDKTEMQALEEIVNRILPKIERQTDYYNDDRTGKGREANIVAPSGQRIASRF